jgi:hypothetical protein
MWRMGQNIHIWLCGQSWNSLANTFGAWTLSVSVVQSLVEMYRLLEAYILKYWYMHDLIYTVYLVCLVRCGGEMDPTTPMPRI